MTQGYLCTSYGSRGLEGVLVLYRDFHTIRTGTMNGSKTNPEPALPLVTEVWSLFLNRKMIQLIILFLVLFML